MKKVKDALRQYGKEIGRLEKEFENRMNYLPIDGSGKLVSDSVKALTDWFNAARREIEKSLAKEVDMIMGVA